MELSWDPLILEVSSSGFAAGGLQGRTPRKQLIRKRPNWEVQTSEPWSSALRTLQMNKSFCWWVPCLVLRFDVVSLRSGLNSLRSELTTKLVANWKLYWQSRQSDTAERVKPLRAEMGVAKFNSRDPNWPFTDSGIAEKSCELNLRNSIENVAICDLRFGALRSHVHGFRVFEPRAHASKARSNVPLSWLFSPNLCYLLKFLLVLQTWSPKHYARRCALDGKLLVLHKHRRDLAWIFLWKIQVTESMLSEPCRWSS